MATVLAGTTPGRLCTGQAPLCGPWPLPGAGGAPRERALPAAQLHRPLPRREWGLTLNRSM